MKIIYGILLIFVMLSPACSAYPKTITGTVVDEETGKPIEGAVVLVEWTRVHGLGNTYTTSDKVIEVLTDKEGRFSLIDDRGGLPPDVTVYKAGYVAWSSRWIFPSWKNRTDFKWQNESLFKMAKFKDTYSYIKHRAFITASINFSLVPEKKLLFMKSYDKKEERETLEELSEEDNKGGKQ